MSVFKIRYVTAVLEDVKGHTLSSTQAVLQTQSRGFLINHMKSRLTPENKFQWLGIQWNTTRAIISLPVEKRLTFTRAVSSFVKSHLVTRRMLDKVMGAVQFASIVDLIQKTTLNYRVAESEVFGWRWSRSRTPKNTRTRSRNF